MNILITGVGGPTPRSYAYALKSLSNFGTDHRIIGVDANPLSVGLYIKGLFEHTVVIPRADQDDYWPTIDALIQKESIQYAVILPEMEAMAWSKRNETHSLQCPSFLPQYSVCELLVQKSKTTELLKALDVTPASVLFDRNDAHLDDIFDRLGSNFWVRSDSGTSGLGSLHIDSKDALVNWVQINSNVQYFLASSYLPGRNLACKLLYWEGSLVRAACAERVNYIMAKVAPSGITGNTSFGRLLNEPALVEVADKAMSHIFQELGVPKHGFFTVDFKEDSAGNPMITEINIRHVAFTQCFAAGGANFAEDTHRLMVGDHTFDKNYQMYEFPEGLIFLRDVDERPIIMFERDLKKL